MILEEKQSGFVAGTLVHTDKGLVPIQNVKVGDLILSSPERGNGTVREYKRIANTFKTESEDIWQLGLLCYKKIDNSDDLLMIKEFVYLTKRHPVYLVDSDEFRPNESNKWMVASDLIPDERILLITNEGERKYDVASIKPVYQIDLDKGFCEQQDAWSDFHSFVKFNKVESYETIGYWNSTPYDYEVSKGNFREFDYSIDENLQNLMGENISDKILQMPVFNLEVIDFHTYFVGELGLWVHDASTNIS
jgi:hypothetical protein